MTITTLCETCTERPANHDTWLCNPCTDQLHADLHAAPNWWHELDIERCKLSRKGAGNGGRSNGERALPYSPEAGDAQQAIRQALRDLGHLVGISHGGHEVQLLVELLLTQERALPAADGIGSATHRLREAIREAQRLCGPPPEKRTYLGLCRVCDQPMRTARVRGWHRCCDQLYDIEQANAETLARLHDPDNNLTQQEAATLLGVTVNAIKQRVKNRKVQPVIDGRKGVWYRLGDLA